MALPTRGQHDWDDDLNNYIAGLEARLQAAENSAASAQSNANYAKNRADAVTLNSDSQTADQITNGAATKAALNTSSVPKWQPSTAYTAGQIVMAPDGSLVERISNGTSGSSYTAANWKTATGLANMFGRLSGVQAVATANAALVPMKHNPVDATSGSLTMTLADATDAGQMVVVSKKDATANTITVSVAHLRDGGAGSLPPLVGQYEAIILTSKADGSWWPIADHKTKAYFDANYATTIRETGLGVSADTAKIQAALDAGGHVRLAGDPTVAFVVNTLNIKSNSHLDLGGRTLKLANGVNADLITVPNFSTLTGGNTSGGESAWSIRNGTLDGNGANQTGTSWTLRVYASNYSLTGVEAISGLSGNYYSEWGTASGGDLEAVIGGCKFRTPTGTGAVNVDFRGPHDSVFQSVEVVSGTSNLAQYGIWCRGNSGGEKFANVHVWGLHNIGWTQEHSCLAVGCVSEGALTNLLVSSSRVRWDGKIFGASRNNEIGVQVSQGVGECDLNIHMFQFSNALGHKPITFAGTGSAGTNRILGVVNGFGANSIVSGTTNATDYADVINTDSKTLGYTNRPSPLVVQLTSGNAVTFRKAVGSGIRVNVDTNSVPERVQFYSGTRTEWYPDQGSTVVARIDSADGSITPGMPTGLGIKINSGTGAPAYSAALNDMYIRKDGGAGTRIYFCTTASSATTGAWTAVL
ncbi:MAG: hypothetical protein ACXVGN_00115 [Mycobacteriaceae bacterium]